MRKALCFVMLLALSFTACAKDFDDSQARQDLSMHYQAQSGSKTRLECQTEVSQYETLEKFSKDDKVEIKIITTVKRVCTRKRKVKGWNRLLAGMIDGSSGFRPGIVVFQECFDLEYERFDEGFKLKKKTQKTNCPKSRDFSARRKSVMEGYLKEIALAACYCKHNECEPYEDDCGVGEQKDINGDGIAELLVGDTCGGNAGICSSKLWSLINGQPRMLSGVFSSLKFIESSSGGSYPVIVTETADGGYISYDSYRFDRRRGEYLFWKSRKRKFRRIKFFAIAGTEIFINGRKAGITQKKSDDTISFVLERAPDRPFKIELKKKGYKTETLNWDWEMVPRCYEAYDGGGSVDVDLEKE